MNVIIAELIIPAYFQRIGKSSTLARSILLSTRFNGRPAIMMPTSGAAIALDYTSFDSKK